MLSLPPPAPPPLGPCLTCNAAISSGVSWYCSKNLLTSWERVSLRGRVIGRVKQAFAAGAAAAASAVPSPLRAAQSPY